MNEFAIFLLLNQAKVLHRNIRHAAFYYADILKPYIGEFSICRKDKKKWKIKNTNYSSI